MSDLPTCIRRTSVVCLFVFGSGTVPAQPTEAATQLVWALDAGVQSAPTPVLRIYDPAGREVFVVSSLPGSGQARGFTFDRQGFVYLARGDAVHQLNAAGVATGVTFNPPSGGSQAQDVVETPDGKLIISWGATQTASRIGIYQLSPPLAAPTVSLGPTGLSQPRRLAARPEAGNGTCYVANRDSSIISSFNHLSASPTLTQVIDLTGQNLGPVGLAHDIAADRLIVVGDWGTATAIALVTLLPAPALATLITYPLAGASSASGGSGMRAPTSCYFDRFRRLYIAGRNQNTGTPGVYVLNADTGNVLTAIVRFPQSGTTPSNIVDVELQPAVIESCVPTFNNAGALAAGPNTILFRCPDYPTRFYAAALSFRWELGCLPAGYIPGILSQTIPFGFPDPRGVPLNDDFLFRGTAAVPVPGPSPVTGGTSLSPFINITGFLGTLDSSGNATATVDCSGLIPLGGPPTGLEGATLSLAWVVFDANVASSIGYVSQPVCLTFRDNAAAVTQPTTCP